jgi:hypothetical protein
MKMSEEKFVFTTKKEKDWLIGLLKSEIVELTFTKKDGTERIMVCTLAEQEIPEENLPKGTNRKKSDETVAVFDLHNQDWRCFRWDSLKNIAFTLGSLKNA